MGIFMLPHGQEPSAHTQQSGSEFVADQENADAANSTAARASSDQECRSTYARNFLYGRRHRIRLQ